MSAHYLTLGFYPPLIETIKANFWTPGDQPRHLNLTIEEALSKSWLRAAL